MTLKSVDLSPASWMAVAWWAEFVVLVITEILLFLKNEHLNLKWVQFDKGFWINQT